MSEKLFDGLYDESELQAKKAEAFDKIAEMFYNRNFGATSKSEMELLMFSILMDGMIHKYSNGDILDMNACSDYNMAKMLGIKQTAVKNLKLKKQARYPVEFDWRKSLESIMDSIRYDSRKNKVIIPAPDPNLYEEIRNFIQEKGGYIDIQPGSNVIQIRPEYYFLLLYESIESDEEKTAIRLAIAEQLKKCNENNDFGIAESDENLKEQIFDGTDTLLEVIITALESSESPTMAIFKCTKNLIGYMKPLGLSLHPVQKFTVTEKYKKSGFILSGIGFKDIKQERMVFLLHKTTYMT